MKKNKLNKNTAIPHTVWKEKNVKNSNQHPMRADVSVEREWGAGWYDTLVIETDLQEKDK